MIAIASLMPTPTIMTDINDTDGRVSISPKEKLQIEKLIEKWNVALKEDPLRTPAPRTSNQIVTQCTSESRKTKLKPLNTPPIIIMFKKPDQLASKIIELRKKSRPRNN